jgi:hypothetical protein
MTLVDLESSASEEGRHVFVGGEIAAESDWWCTECQSNLAHQRIGVAGYTCLVTADRNMWGWWGEGTRLKLFDVVRRYKRARIDQARKDCGACFGLRDPITYEWPVGQESVGNTLMSWRIKLDPPPEVVRRAIAIAREARSGRSSWAGRVGGADRGSSAAITEVSTGLGLFLAGVDRRKGEWGEGWDGTNEKAFSRPLVGPQYEGAGTIFDMACAIVYCKRGLLATTGV